MHKGLLLGAALSLLACNPARSPTSDLDQSDEMIEAVEARAGAGSPIADAREFMEQEGFECSEVTNGSFVGRDGIDYLYCDRRDGSPVARRWQVAIVHRGGLIVEVLATTGLIGP
jgi:hypothetical protein